MAKPYAQDLRERVKDAVEGGQAQSAVAQRFGVGIATVERYLARWRKTGSLAPDKFGGHKRHKLAAHADKIKALVKAEPDQSLAELRAKLEAAKIVVSASALDRFLKAAGFSYKKNAGRRRTRASGRR